MKIAILVLAHKPIYYYEQLALENSDLLFFIHFDKKCNYPETHLKNMIYIDKEYRVDVKWGGFSQVQAMLNIFQYALSYSEEIEYFHLISGEEVLLLSNNQVFEKLSWDTSEIFIELINSKPHRYRVRFPAIHVETKWQRKPLGKVVTLMLKILDKIFPTSKQIWFGSNWFSIKRNELLTLINHISQEDLTFFRKRLNPDEHFFQYLIIKAKLQKQVSELGNKRSIIFDKNYNNGNNPIYLNLDQLVNISNEHQYLFARKVHIKEQLEFFEKVNASV
ncbi:beta-1,6-N-acetylglucosaminyltransferase [Acinetobacter ursingii]|uniref:beta-1,6-N-acetylglucosaminyltransferase n=1 Tax=Acinetobacter TaxID=469 RepID=UPI001A566431|nr:MULTISPECIES: beta-1,6-N-acetylglucosaminyltransferase [Acinetobacter]MDG9949229.1 beta-1,6-N-acetylglucosaminyltransferase [Acinetobacter ursingii]UYF78945.1 beta-1,6-N-acetylglucosaminyltransferase [Acinetobacter ursingii]VTX53516.1 Core-2/I-Branching enzyme [Acinetobacter ursingii]